MSGRTPNHFKAKNIKSTSFHYPFSFFTPFCSFLRFIQDPSILFALPVFLRGLVAMVGFALCLSMVTKQSNTVSCKENKRTRKQLKNSKVICYILKNTGKRIGEVPFKLESCFAKHTFRKFIVKIAISSILGSAGTRSTAFQGATLQLPVAINKLGFRRAPANIEI